MNKNIIEYEADGVNYFKEWFNKLNKQLQYKVFVRLNRVSNGNYDDTSNEGHGIIALRFIKEGLRIYISNIDNITVILLCGGDKSSKAQQNKDIQQARKFLEEYKSRK